MNIKGIARNLLPFEVGRVKSATKVIKSETSTDRDANGKREDPDPERRKLTEDEKQEVMEHLLQLPGLKSNHLSARMVNETGVCVVLIEDPSGKVVRRIPELELVQLIKNRAKETGQIFDRAM